MTNAFHLRVFGPPALLGLDGHPLKFRTKKQLALLVYLSLDNDDAGVSRDTLVDLLWPEAGNQRGRHSLSQGLSAIRRLLGSHAVKSSGNRLRLMTSLPTDLEAVGKNGRIAGNLARPLQDLDDCSGVDFAHWVDASRERMLQVARAELLRAFHEARRAGDVDRVQLLATQLYEVDPQNEQAVQAMAERQLVEGDIAQAIGLLRDFLARTDDAEASGDHVQVRRLLERIESGAHPPADIVPTERLEGVRNRQGDSHFVGRAEELAHLEAMWEQAKAGRLRTCLMRGVAGIGKSAILKRFATAVAARGNLAVAIRCQEIGAAVPFSALGDLIEVLSRDPALGGTDPYWLAEASRIAPLLKAKYPGLPEPGPAPGESIRLRVAEAVYRMLETVAENAAMCLAIDDLQHMDQASKDVLHIVSRRLVETPAFILATMRTEGLDHRSVFDRPTSNLTEWQDTLDLQTLSNEESNALVVRLSPELQLHADCRAIREGMVALADGNPYFLEMLISDWKTHGEESLAVTEATGKRGGAKWRPPDALRLTFSRHYEGLGARGRQAIELLAVAGRAMNAAELGQLLGVGTVPASQLVLEIIERGVLRLEGDAVSFKNELHRAFVYYAAPDPARRYHHARLARALVERARSTAFPGHLEAAHHFLQAGMHDEAAESALEGAEVAVARGAPREAERALEEVIRVLPAPPASSLLLLIEALNQQGQYAQALNWVGRVTRPTATPVERCRLTTLTAEAMVRGRVGDPEDVERVVRRGLREVRQLQAAPEMPKMLQTAAEMAAQKGDAKWLLTVRQEAETAARKAGDRAFAAFSEMTSGYCLYASGQFADAYHRFTSSTDVLEKIGHATLVRALNGRAVCASAMGEFTIAMEAFDRALFVASRTGDYAAGCNISCNFALMLTNLGRVDEAEILLEKAIDFRQRTSQNPYSGKVFACASTIALTRGDLDKTAEILAHVDRELDATRDVRWMVDILLTKADYFLAAGLLEEALKIIAEAETVSPKFGRPSETYHESLARLTEYRAWKLGKTISGSAEDQTEKMALSLAAFAELKAFRAWLGVQSGRPDITRPTAMEVIEATELWGIKAYLEVVGMFPNGDGQG